MSIGVRCLIFFNVFWFIMFSGHEALLLIGSVGMKAVFKVAFARMILGCTANQRCGRISIAINMRNELELRHTAIEPDAPLGAGP
jgi:hypothetical protein